MPEIRQVTVYSLDELAAPAAEKARSWYRDVGLDDDWYGWVYEDFIHICKILGIDIAMQACRAANGKPIRRPSVWFSGFGNQGDGASFAGQYRYAKRAHQAIRDYAPTDTALHHSDRAGHR